MDRLQSDNPTPISCPDPNIRWTKSIPSAISAQSDQTQKRWETIIWRVAHEDGMKLDFIDRTISHLERTRNCTNQAHTDMVQIKMRWRLLIEQLHITVENLQGRTYRWLVEAPWKENSKTSLLQSAKKDENPMTVLNPQVEELASKEDEPDQPKW